MWLGWPHPTGSDWLLRCLGDPSSESLSMVTLLASINELEKKLSHVVKATVESTLGRLGTVGAMAIEFVERLKTVVVNAATAEEASGPSTSGGTGGIQASVVAPVVAPPAGSVTVREGGSIASSTMPSAFGDVRFRRHLLYLRLVL